jgi:hypothetical protein
MTSPILFVGSEDLSFSFVGSGVSIATTTGYFRSGYARYGLSVNAANGVSYIQSSMFAPSSTFWVSARSTNLSVTGGGSGPQPGGPLFELIDSNNVVRLKASVATVPFITFQKLNSVAAATTLGVSATGLVLNTATPAAGPDKLDIFVNYSTSGSLVFYLNGVPIFSYVGDLTTDGQTTLSGLILGYYVGPGFLDTEFTVWSEVIVSTRDTRPMSVVTQVGAANGNTDTFTQGLVSNINANNYTTANPDYSTIATQNQEYTVTPNLPSGYFGIISVVQQVFTTVGLTGPSHLNLIARVNGIDYFSPALTPFIGVFSMISYNWDTSPNTLIPWRTNELVATSTSFNFGYHSMV